MPITALMMQAVRNGAAMAAQSPTPAPSFSTKTQHYTFRTSTPPYAGASDPSDATQATNVVIGGTGVTNTLYPTLGDDGKNYGLNIAATQSVNATATQAGNNPLLGGTVRIQSGNYWYKEMDPGTYDVRIALGFASAAARCVGALIDGSLAGLTADIGATSLIRWSSGGTRTLNSYVVVADGSIWKVTTGGTSGTTEPTSASTSPFADNTATLTKQSRSALLVLDATPGSTSQVVDQNNNPATAASGWLSTTPKSVVVTNRGGNTGLTFLYIGANSCDVRDISITRTA